MGIEKLVHAFLSLIIQICLEAEVSKLPKIDQFIDPKNTTNLRLIQDATNPMTRWEMQGA